VDDTALAAPHLFLNELLNNVGEKDVTSIDESRKRCFWKIDKETHKRERDKKIII